MATESKTGMTPPFAAFRQAAALQQQGKLAEAARLLRSVTKEQPGNFDAWYYLGLIRLQQQDWPEAIRVFTRALAARPAPQQIAAANFNLGLALRAANRLEESVAAYASVLAIDGRNAQVHHNQGNVLLQLNRFAAATERFQKAVALEPELYDAHINLALTQLAAGDYANGWRNYEWRWRRPGYAPRGFTQPLWRGEALGDGVLLLHGEAGFGDMMQFCRYASLAARRARIVLEVPAPLVRLMSTLAGPADVVPYGAALPHFDTQCPLMSLPLAFGTTLATIPAEIPYLHADAGDVESWRQRLRALPGLKIGLAWAGDPRPTNAALNAYDRRRSMCLSDLAPFAELPGVSWISLQKGAAAAQSRTPPRGMKLHDFTADLGDFAHTAALIAALDLVITVDTSIVHVAGALAKPTWLLNRFDSCWRWNPASEESLWYPTVRQFRQTAPGDWASATLKARERLKGLVGASAASDGARSSLR